MDNGYAFTNTILPVNIFIRHIVSWHDKKPAYTVDFGVSIGAYIEDILKSGL